MSFNPFAWYWLADDGRVFTSARQLIVDINDAGYVAWSASNFATPWPRDDAGNQTDQSLQDVLTPYNLWVDLTAYTANARYNHASGGVTITSLSPVSFLSDPTSRNTVNSAYDYALVNPAVVVQWKMSDGTFIALDQTKITTVMNNMASFVHSCFDEESTLVTGIIGGTITTQAQIDAAFAAISNVFP